MALEFVPRIFACDLEIVLTAVETAGGAFRFACHDLHLDRTVVLQSVQQTGSALQFAGEQIRKDRGVVLTAITQDVTSLRCTSIEMLSDPECVLSAMKHGGLAMHICGEAADVSQHAKKRRAESESSLASTLCLAILKVVTRFCMSVARHGTHSNSSLQTYNVSVCTSGPCSSLSRFHACVSAILVRVGSASLSFRLQVSPRTGLETGRMLDATGMKANENLENNSLKEWIEI